MQIALFIELAALIVEAVGDLVPNHGAFSAKVGGIVRITAEEWRLQDAGGKINGVELGIVIGVDGGRSHGPVIAVNGLADFLQPAVELKGGGVVNVFQIRIRLDFQSRVVAPLVGITNFVEDGMELGAGLLFGCIGHPA